MAALVLDGGVTALRETLAQALAHHRRGELAAARALYARALEAAPSHPDALHLLGVLHHQEGDHARAAELIARAIEAAPRPVPDFHNNRGEALRALGRIEDAASCYRRAVELEPRHAEAHSNLGVALHALGRLAEARDCHRRALALAPERAAFHNNSGLALKDLGDDAAAEAAFRRAIALAPAGYADPRLNLAGTLLARGLDAEAEALYRGLVADGLAAVQAHTALAGIALGRGEAAAAEARYRAALALAPGHAPALTGLGCALVGAMRQREGIAFLRKAVEADPDDAVAHSNLLLSLQYPDDVPDETLREAHVAFGHRFGRSEPAHHTNPRDPERRLRIGYVSPDLRHHSVSYFLLRPLEGRDRAVAEVVLYSDTAREDDLTDRLRRAADAWRPVRGMSDDALADLVRRDGIDILVDLAGHTAGNRLPAFAHKPAPVQLSWIGYPDDTGLAAIDARIGDDIADPPHPDAAEDRILRLPGPFLCYDPPGDGPAVSARPAGSVVFGSFNNLAKVTDRMLDAWASILNTVPSSLLHLKARALADRATCGAVVGALARRGVGPERLVLEPQTESRGDHLARYGEIDVALDTFPYNGTTTTCEALWMGVPVVTLAGTRHAARVGASLLAQAGLGELVADSPERYVAIATALARDDARRAGLRRSLRPRLLASPLCDGVSVARGLERAYRAAWQRHCSGAAA